MPNAAINIIRTRPITELGCVTTNDLVPLLLLEKPKCPREKTGCNEIEQACGCNQEDLQLGDGTTPIKRLM